MFLCYLSVIFWTFGTVSGSLNAFGQKNRFYIGVFLPLTGTSRRVGQEVVIAANIALDFINEDASFKNLRATGRDFRIQIRDTSCDKRIGLTTVVNLATQVSEIGEDLDAFIGPQCDSVCETVGLLSTSWSIPLLSYGCHENYLDNTNLYTTFIQTSSAYSSMKMFMRSTVQYFGWDRVMLITEYQTVWLRTEESFNEELRNHGITSILWEVTDREWADMDTLLPQKAQESYVFILLMYAENVLRLMQAANNTGLLTDQYVFISLDYANFGKRLLHPLHGPHLEGLLDITPDITPTSASADEFVSAIVENATAAKGYVNTSCMNYEYAIHAGLLHDSVVLYAWSVDASVGANTDPTNGSLLAQRMRGAVVEGVTGTVRIDSNGIRQLDYMLNNIQENCYVPVAKSLRRGVGFERLNATIVFAGGGTNTPSGRPYCGWDNRICDDRVTTIAASTTSVAVVLVIAGVIIFAYWRSDQKKKESSREWIIHYTELVHKDRANSRSKSNLGSSGSRAWSPTYSIVDSRDSATTASSYGQVFAEHYHYHDEEVAGKPVYLGDRTGMLITHAMSKEINMVRELSASSPNVCRLFGVCIDPGTEMALWEYCKKGSLQDVLNNDKTYLEDMPFKISFMNDITKGLRFLHHSSLGKHARLKSSNILVDCRWTCKLAHMVIPSITVPDKFEGDNINHGRYLATPPEVLRDPTLSIPGTKAADVYAFGIILLEIFTVAEIQEAFSAAYAKEKAAHAYRKRQRRNKRRNSVENINIGFELTPANVEIMEAEEIVKRVKKGGSFPFRPYIPEYIDHRTKNAIMECWREQPEERPSIDHVASLVRQISQQYSAKNKSLMEQMLDKVTREADMQAQELQEEKHKADQLLYQMLPATVADSLKRHQEVKPETFQSASIYFSDIQGFTDLAAVSEPLEIVTFLNDVYYRFDMILEKYRVYKVETIGDAYMVSSGVPILVEDHASELAKMALHLIKTQSELKVHHRPGLKFHMRIGLHTGAVAAGVVGRTMPRYCLFGDTVNTASRMESTGLPGHIQISEQYKHMLDQEPGFITEAREPITVKGKGVLQTYFLKGKEGFHPNDSLDNFDHLNSVDTFETKPEPPRNHAQNGHVKKISEERVNRLSDVDVKSALIMNSPTKDYKKVSVLGSDFSMNEGLSEVAIN